MKVSSFIEASKDKSSNPFALGFNGFNCGIGIFHSKVLPKVRKVLKSYNPSSKVKLSHRKLMKPGARGIKCNFHVVEGWIGSEPISIVLDEKYREVKA